MSDNPLADIIADFQSLRHDVAELRLATTQLGHLISRLIIAGDAMAARLSDGKNKTVMQEAVDDRLLEEWRVAKEGKDNPPVVTPWDDDPDAQIRNVMGENPI